jgi:hypothetical protein
VDGHKERGNECEYGGCISYSYENRRMKPVEVILRKEEGRDNDAKGKSN